VQKDAANVSTIDDKAEFGLVMSSLTQEGFTQMETDDLFKVVAAILHFGQVTFQQNTDISSSVSSPDVLASLSRLLGVSADQIEEALTHRTIVARGQSTSGTLDADKAKYACDALSKALYSRMFTWLVNRINEAITASDSGSRMTVMGLLDIYGFEIMQTNSFEQLCINYCNEKLQQLFIELTLKAEQEEYKNEGIEWTPVEYFNNKIICDMMEMPHKGIVSVLDNECLMPGKHDDDTFLINLSEKLGQHDHFKSWASADRKTQRRASMKGDSARREFRIKHYAGWVTYNTSGFVDKNNDLLFRDLKQLCVDSTNMVCKACFPPSELDSHKRPDTAGTDFKKSLNSLIKILMVKSPSYCRTLKPNHEKKAKMFDSDLIRHQSKYLGLMENLRVRRAGFAYRRKFEIFLDRYKPLCKATWPHWNGEPKEGVRKIMAALKLGANEFKIGKTKIFVKEPKTVFRIEDMYNKERENIAAKIQATWKMKKQRDEFQSMKAAVSLIANQWRRVAAKKAAAKLKAAYATIRRFYVAFKKRHEPRCAENAIFLDFVRLSWIKFVRDKLPSTVMDKSWITNSPPYLEEASQVLRKMYMAWMARKYRNGITAQHKKLMDEKLFTSGLLREKRASYPASVAQVFYNDRLIPALRDHPLKPTLDKVLAKFGSESIVYSTSCIKYNRSDYKPQDEVLIATTKAIYLLEAKKFKLKSRLAYTDLLDITITPGHDNLLILNTKLEEKSDKGDFVLEVPYLIEAAVKLSKVRRRDVLINGSKTDITHKVKGEGKPPLVIRLNEGREPSALRDKKSKQLTVTYVKQQDPPSWAQWLQTKGDKTRAPAGLIFGKSKYSAAPSQARGSSGGGGRGGRTAASSQGHVSSGGRGRGGRTSASSQGRGSSGGGRTSSSSQGNNAAPRKQSSLGGFGDMLQQAAPVKKTIAGRVSTVSPGAAPAQPRRVSHGTTAVARAANPTKPKGPSIAGRVSSGEPKGPSIAGRAAGGHRAPPAAPVQAQAGRARGRGGRIAGRARGRGRAAPGRRG
jgi:myosin-1